MFPCVWGEGEGEGGRGGGGDEVWDNGVIGSLLDTWIFTMDRQYTEIYSVKLTIVQYQTYSQKCKRPAWGYEFHKKLRFGI